MTWKPGPQSLQMLFFLLLLSDFQFPKALSFLNRSQWNFSHILMTAFCIRQKEAVAAAAADAARCRMGCVTGIDWLTHVTMSMSYIMWCYFWWAEMTWEFPRPDSYTLLYLFSLVVRFFRSNFTVNISVTDFFLSENNLVWLKYCRSSVAESGWSIRWWWVMMFFVQFE